MVDEMNPVNFRLDSSNFNIDNGYLDGIVRGFKSGILTEGDYVNLTQCDTLEGRPKQATYYAECCAKSSTY